MTTPVLVDHLYADGAAPVLSAVSAEPAAAAAGQLRHYAKNIAGRMLPKWMDHDGVDYPFQSGLAFNNVSVIGPGGGTTVGVTGAVLTNVGTISNPTPSTGSLKNQTRRFANVSAATAGALASTRVNVLECWRGNAAGLGGFFVLARFSLDTLQAGMRAFVGLTDTATTAPTNIDPTTSATPGKIGLAINANIGNWTLVNNVTGTAPTVLALGANFPVNTTTQIEMILYAPPNGAGIGYRLTNQSTGAAPTTGTLTTNIPASTTFLGRTAWATNNATAAAVQWSMSRFYLETGF